MYFRFLRPLEPWYSKENQWPVVQILLKPASHMVDGEVIQQWSGSWSWPVAPGRSVVVNSGSLRMAWGDACASRISASTLDRLDINIYRYDINNGFPECIEVMCLEPTLVVHNEFSGVQTLLLRKSGSIAACFAAIYISGAAPVSKRCSLRFCEGHFLSLPPWRGKRNRLTQWRYCNVSMTQSMADKNSMDMEAMKARMAEMEAQMATMKDQMAQMTQMTQMAMGTDGSSQETSHHRPSDPRTPVIIDTDVDTDDQMAIAYLLAQPDFRVLAITVGCNGWSQQWAGVMSIMRLTKYFGQPHIPVAFSFRYNSDTQLNLNEPNGLPDPTLLAGKGNFLSEFVGLPFNIRPPSWMYTGRLLTDTLSKSARKVDIIALGPLTNLAHFLQDSPRLFYLEGESDLQLRRHCGFAIQHPNWQSLALLRSRHLCHRKPSRYRMEHLQWSSCSQFGPVLWGSHSFGNFHLHRWHAVLLKWHWFHPSIVWRRQGCSGHQNGEDFAHGRWWGTLRSPLLGWVGHGAFRSGDPKRRESTGSCLYWVGEEALCSDVGSWKQRLSEWRPIFPPVGEWVWTRSCPVHDRKSDRVQDCIFWRVL